MGTPEQSYTKSFQSRVRVPLRFINVIAYNITLLQASPDLNLTPLAAFFTVFAKHSEASLRSAKKWKKRQQEVSELNRD